MINKIVEFFKKTKIRSVLPLVSVLLVIVVAIIFLWQGSANSNQSVPVTPANVYFEGKYRIGDGELHDIVKGEHIPSTNGDVTLIGNFHYYSPKGEYIGVYKGKTAIAFYTDHINLTFKQSGNTYVTDHENPIFGESACGVGWTARTFLGGEDVIEIVVHNPHNFGNENAIDQMLSNTAFWADIEFKKGILDSGSIQRNVGLAFIIASVIFLGTALFSSLIHVKNSKILWLLGLVILSAGLCFTYSSFGISFWSESIVFNTSILGVSMMLYTFFLSLIIAVSLKKMKKIGLIASIVLGTVNVMLFVLSMVANLYFYDTLRYWLIVQSIVNIVLIVCIIRELFNAKSRYNWVYIGATLPLVAFCVDSFATWFGLWEGAIISQCVFIVLFVVATIVLLRIIPQNINAIAKSKELESEKLLLNAQLTQSRVSTMMSQIRPHFIYNTLGSIEQLCELDPPKAGELVHNFAKYLRGNFGELDNLKPILMTQEMEHVHYYVNIEKVRFPDMNFYFEMNSNDFYIPALTVQPIVENAIKHGLMKLQNGGTIKVVTYETDDSYCVKVEDDGVGFDTLTLQDDKNHVGIRNIRGRLKAMVNGTLEIESTIGVGTKVTITIPKGE